MTTPTRYFTLTTPDTLANLASRAVALAKAQGVPVKFTRNGVDVWVQPGDGKLRAMTRYHVQAWIDETLEGTD